MASSEFKNTRRHTIPSAARNGHGVVSSAIDARGQQGALTFRQEEVEGDAHEVVGHGGVLGRPGWIIKLLRATRLSLTYGDERDDGTHAEEETGCYEKYEMGRESRTW